MWADGMREAEIARVDYDVRERSEYINSPANEIHDGATRCARIWSAILRSAASTPSMTRCGRKAEMPLAERMVQRHAT